MEGGLPPGTEATLVHGMQRIPLHLDDMSIPIFSEDPAPCRTLPAGGCIPGGLTRDDIFRGDDVGNQLSGRLRGATRGSPVPARPIIFKKSLRPNSVITCLLYPFPVCSWAPWPRCQITKWHSACQLPVPSQPAPNPSVTGGKMVGGRASVALGETLWRHLSVVDSRDRPPLRLPLQLHGRGNLSLRRFAMQGFAEDHTGAVATCH